MSVSKNALKEVQEWGSMGQPKGVRKIGELESVIFTAKSFPQGR